MASIRLRAASALLSAVSLAALSNVALAQSAAQLDVFQVNRSAPAASQNANDSGDIVVTARKREERLSDVPVTISASTGDQLQSAGVTDVTQLGKIAPSFTSAASVFGFQVFSIRGVNFNTQQASAPPAVAVYVDQAPLPYSVMTGGMMLDVERVEVLKGPQGTLFGQNATGGLVNVIAAKPTSDLRAGIRFDVNHFGEVTTEGYVSGPITDTLRARVAGSTTQFGAWQKGYYLNNNKNGDQNRGAARLLLDWTPSERLTVGININGNYDHGEGIQPQLGLLSIANPANTQPGLVGYPQGNKNRDADIDSGFNTHAHNQMLQANLRVDYEFSDAATFTSLTSYAKFDQDGTNINYDGVALPNAYTGVFAHVKTFNQEARLAGSVGESKFLDYVVGASYSNDRINEGVTETFNGASALPLGTDFRINYDLRARASAIFGNIDLKVVPNLTVSAGLRKTWTRQSIYGCTFDGGNGIWSGIFGFVSQSVRNAQGLGPLPAGAFAPGTCSTINDNVPNVANPNGAGLIPDFLPIYANGVQKEDNLSWRASVSYKIDPDNMLYGTVSRGFKAGVFPVQPNIVNSGTVPVRQEQLTSYEIGAKLALFDRNLRLNVSAFHYDYRDKQFYTYLPIPSLQTLTSLIINIPKSTVNGIDADVVIKPVSGLTLRAAGTYIDTKVKKLAAGQTVYSGLTGMPFDPTGKNFNYAPPWSATFDAEYQTPVADRLNLVLGAGGQWYSKSYSDLGQEAALANPTYVTVDLRVGLQSAKGWRATLWVRNIGDKDYWTSIFRAGDMLSRYAGRPRTFGASASFTF